MDRQRQIKTKQWLTKLKLDEIQRSMEDEPHGRHLQNNSENEEKQWFLGFAEKGGDVFLKDVRMVVEKTLVTNTRMLSLV